MLGADIFFLDPPYRLDWEYDAALHLLARAPKLVVVQHDIRQKLGESYGTLRQVRQLRQGDNVLSLYHP